MHRLLALVTLLLASGARALSPADLLVVVNTAEPASREVANWFVDLRGVPGERVIPVRLDPAHHSLQIGTNGFRTLILQPVSETATARGLAGQVTAWIYSAGFPTTVRTDPEMSLTGFTFTGGQIPPADRVKNGTYISPYFAGPGERAPPGPVAGLRVRQAGLGAGAPLPCLMLGVTRKFGNTPQTLVEMLQRGVAAEASRTAGPVWFLRQNDVRWTCREWQMAPTVEELRGLGVEAAIVGNLRRSAPPLAGFMTGAQRIDLEQMPPFLPGALAEHLTSFAAYYQAMNQMRCTAWFEQGASGSAGTVTEPFAIWTKFPHARLFAHYARGATLLESFQQAIACPFQTLVLGDPLCRPYGPRIQVTAQARVDGETLHVTAAAHGQAVPVTYELFLRGRRHGRATGTPDWRVPLSEVDAGRMPFLVVASQSDPLGISAWMTAEADIPHPTASLKVEGPADRLATDGQMLLLRHTGLQGELILWKDAEELARSPVPKDGRAAFPLETARLGRGPSRLHVTAQASDGRTVRSPAVRVRVEE
jgi:hypothetical protein